MRRLGAILLLLALLLAVGCAIAYRVHVGFYASIEAKAGRDTAARDTAR